MQEINAQLLRGLESQSVEDMEIVKQSRQVKDVEFKYHIATCCNPIEGDSVVGIIIPKHNAYKVNIHLTDCKEANNILSKYDCKIIQIKWNEQQEINFWRRLK